MVQAKSGAEKSEPETLPTDPESVAYQRFDAADDEQILAEIQGRNLEILDRLVYSFTDRRGQAVTGLSLTGVRETVREMNRRGLARIRVTSAPPIINETEEHIDALVYAEDDLNGGGSWGSKRQPKRSGTFSNPFALEQALSKAQRNAMFALIPAAYVIEVIRDYSEQGRAHELRSGPRRLLEQSAPALETAQPNRAQPAPANQRAQSTVAAPAKGDPVTEPQLKLLRDLLERNQLDEAELLQKLGLASLTDLSKARGSQLIDRLRQREDRHKQSA